MDTAKCVHTYTLQKAKEQDDNTATTTIMPLECRCVDDTAGIVVFGALPSLWSK